MGEDGEDVKPKLNITVDHEGQSMPFHLAIPGGLIYLLNSFQLALFS